MGRMGVTAALALLATIGASGQMRQPSQAPPTAKSEAEKRILAVLEQARASGDVYLEVPVVDGRMLRVLTEGANAKQVVEFGTSTGYSGLWLCLALQGTGGKLMTFELDAGRAARARKHFEQAGVEKMVTVVEGDAHANVGQIKGPVDVVFIDAEKQGYVEYLKAVLPLVRPGGYILAHNIEMVPDYVKAVTTDPNLETVFFMSGNGLGITLKKR